MTIGLLIKNKRTELSISQKELADTLSISIQRLNNFESEIRVPPLSMLDDLAKALNFNVNNFNKKYDYAYLFNINLFKENLSNYRKSKDLTLNELSSILGVSRQTLSKYEQGESCPNIDEFYKLCEIINILPTDFIYEKNKEYRNNKLSFLKYTIPLATIFILSLFIIHYAINNNNNNSNNNISNSYILPSEPSFSSSSSSSTQISSKENFTTFKMMERDTIKLINDSYNHYLPIKEPNKERPYTIHFNDNNIKDINFYYQEEVILPLYFDDEKFISHYIDENNSIWGGNLVLHFDKDLYFTPVYKTYNEYMKEIEFLKQDKTIYINSTKGSYLFIVPKEIDGINNFIVSDFVSSNRVIIINESNVIFDIKKMDYIPSVYFINAKNIEFINQNLKTDNIAFVAINQNYNYEKTTSFISTYSISYLYLSSNAVYDNFIEFHDDIEYLYLSNTFSLEYLKFIKGNILSLSTFNDTSTLHFISKKRKKSDVKKRLVNY